MKEFIKKNYIIITYIILSMFLEVFGLLAGGFSFIIYKPWFGLTLLGITSSIIILIPSSKWRYVLSSIFLFIQGVINLVMIVIYEMTGTVFDYGMFNLRSDAMGILESIPLNFMFLFVFAFTVIAYVIFAKRGLKYLDVIKNNKKTWIIKSVSIVLMLALNVTVMIGTNKNSYDSDYTKKLYLNAQDKYQEYGMTGNFINELYKFAFYNDVKLGDSKELNDYVYEEVSTPSKYFGISKGNNVVTILVESMEWYAFISDIEKYHNALTKYLTQEDINDLYPNITRYMNDGIVMKNNHAREKTDISENDSIIGSYPTNAYINYDFPSNSNPFTIVNMMKTLDNNLVANSFHNGYTNYYNRTQAHKSLGFDHFYAEEELRTFKDENGEVIMDDWANQGVRNLDSEMFEAAKDIMFQSDERFYTYIISITMHGMYYERENLGDYYDKLYDKLEGTSFDKTDEEAMRVFYYMGCVMEFDKALGVMFEDLEKKDLLDNTTIVMFGDHNTYYQGLSNYVKNIYSYEADDYTNLYNVPLMIYDNKLKNKMDENNDSRMIDKFTTTYDIVPTLLDLLGIKYYSNLYFGNSIFSEEESVLYSRAYNIFLNDDLYLYSMNNILYKSKDVKQQDIDLFESKAKTLLTKLSHIDRIFYNDYFSKNNNEEEFKNNIKDINK